MRDSEADALRGVDGTDRRSSYVTAFGRGLSVLRCFSAGRPTLTIAEVARAAGLNRATARRFLHTLHRDGYLSCHDGRYTLRPAAMELGHAYLSTAVIDDVFQGHLQSLAEQVNKSCSAGALDGHDTVFLARAKPSGTRMMTLTLMVGARVPAYLTALGRVLLADLTDAELADYLDTATLRPETEHTIIDPNRLREELSAIREQGFAILNQEIESGVCAVAVPIHRRTRPPLAVSVATHVAQTPIEALREYLPALRHRAAEIAAR